MPPEDVHRLRGLYAVLAERHRRHFWGISLRVGWITF